ncbi:hypothetical protein AAVH_08147 [Aphelenchoides avenae]|nr:hypothetical protein AAVH_08147 [Aphelenchus avenae]
MDVASSSGYLEGFNKVSEAFVRHFTNRQLDDLVDLYHRDATVVVAGRRAAHGKEAIRKTYLPWMKSTTNLRLHPEQTTVTADGKYIAQVGKKSMDFQGKPQTHHYEVILRREPDGRYLIYHDEFGEQEYYAKNKL